MANERSILQYQSLEVIVPHTGGEGERKGGGGGGRQKLRENGRINAWWAGCAGDSEEVDVQMSDGGEVHSVPQLRVLGDVLPRSTHTSTSGQSLDIYHAQYLQ